MIGQPALTLLHPDAAPEKGGFLNATGSTVDGVTVPFTALDNSKVFAPNELVTGTGIASTDPSMANQWFIPIHEERQGILLPNIPGYPPQLPSLQITPSGRLAFWNFPKYLERWPGATSIWNRGYNTSTKTFTKVSTLLTMNTWDTYINTYSYSPIADQSTYNQKRCEWMFTPAGANFVNQTVYDTNGHEVTAAQCPFAVVNGSGGYTVVNYITSAYKDGGFPDFYYENTRPDQWIAQNIQYWVSQFLNQPYSVCGAVPFGYCWFGVNALFYSAVYTAQLPQFLQNVDFLTCPVGKKTFLDDVYNVVPIIICGAASIITAGAATPMLIAVIGASASYFSTQLGNESKAGTAAIESTAAGNAASNLNVQNIGSTVTTQVENQYGPIIEMPPAQTITLPTNSVMLNAAKTTSVSGTDPLTYAWEIISGPNTPTFDSVSSATPTVSNLEQGSYVFQLTATDTLSNVTKTGTVNVTVLPNPFNAFETGVQSWYKNVQANQKSGLILMALLAAAIITVAVIMYEKDQK